MIDPSVSCLADPLPAPQQVVASRRRRAALSASPCLAGQRRRAAPPPAPQQVLASRRGRAALSALRRRAAPSPAPQQVLASRRRRAALSASKCLACQRRRAAPPPAQACQGRRLLAISFGLCHRVATGTRGSLPPPAARGQAGAESVVIAAGGIRPGGSGTGRRPTVVRSSRRIHRRPTVVRRSRRIHRRPGPGHRRAGPGGGVPAASGAGEVLRF